MTRPLAKYVGGRRTNEHYVDEDDRVLFDDTIELLAAHGLPLGAGADAGTGRPAPQALLPAGRHHGSASSPAAGCAPA